MSETDEIYSAPNGEGKKGNIKSKKSTTKLFKEGIY
ncbi:hypothetical protein J2Y02_000625 [Neobacillus drentensis]|nr:hypothetical protein [Neobacillus drentensis]